MQIIVFVPLLFFLPNFRLNYFVPSRGYGRVFGSGSYKRRQSFISTSKTSYNLSKYCSLL